MNSIDLHSLSQKTRQDGNRLFGVCELIYKANIIFIWFLGITGTIFAIFAMMQASFWVGLVIELVVFFICLGSYAFAVLSTHIAKVLVHTSFASLGILESLSLIASSNHGGLKLSSETENKNNNWVNDFSNKKSFSSADNQEEKTSSIDATAPQYTDDPISIYEQKRKIALEMITKKGYLVNSSGSYPNTKWTILNKGVQIKKAESLDELINFSKSI